MYKVQAWIDGWKDMARGYETIERALEVMAGLKANLILDKWRVVRDE